MSLFRSNTQVRKNRFRPQLEQLDQRITPAVISFECVRGPMDPENTCWRPREPGVASFVTDDRNDDLIIADYGADYAATSPGNLYFDAPGDNGQPRQDLRILFEKNHIWKVVHTDRGGTNRVTYTLYRTLPNERMGLLDRHIETNLGSGNDTFTANLNRELGASSSLNVVARGGAGVDNLQVVVGLQGLRPGADLAVHMQGGLGRDTVSVNASTSAPTIDSGAKITANLYGNVPNSLYDYGDVGNMDVSFWYRGRMDGTLQYNSQGSGGADQVIFNAVLDATSTGAISYAVIFAGGGSDICEIYLRMPNTSRLLGVTYVDPGLEGDLQYFDWWYYYQNRNGYLSWYYFSMIGRDVVSYASGGVVPVIISTPFDVVQVVS